MRKLFFSRSALALLVFAASPVAVLAADYPLWPLPEGLHATPLADEMRLNGLVMRVALVSGIGSERELRRAMEKSCTQQRGDFGEAQAGTRHLWSCIHPPISQTLQWRQEGGRIVGELATMRLDRKPKPVAPPLALPDSAEILSDVFSRDGRKEGQVILFQSSWSVPQLRAWFLREARAQGWKLVDVLSAQSQRLSMRKGTQSLDLAFPPSGSEAASRAVLVWQSRE